MGDDWKAGDLAIRVRRGLPCPDCGIAAVVEPGAVVAISEVRILHIGLTLFLEGHPARVYRRGCVHIGEDPANYHKIPRHTPDAEDAETTALLTGKPTPADAAMNEGEGR